MQMACQPSPNNHLESWVHFWLPYIGGEYVKQERVLKRATSRVPLTNAGNTTNTKLILVGLTNLTLLGTSRLLQMTNIGLVILDHKKPINSIMDIMYRILSPPPPPFWIGIVLNGTIVSGGEAKEQGPLFYLTRFCQSKAFSATPHALALALEESRYFCLICIKKIQISRHLISLGYITHVQNPIRYS